MLVGLSVWLLLAVRRRAAELDRSNLSLREEIAERQRHAEHRERAEEEVRRSREQLRTLNAELERRVEARTAELEAANKELEAFAYSVSHDLRAPLRAVQGFSRIVLDECGETLPAEAARHLHLVLDGASQMGRLIDDLLEFSRLGRRELRHQQVDLSAIARAALEELRPAMEGRDVQFSLGDLPPARGDSAMLTRVFVNLLSNALKFTRERDPAVIEVGARLDDGGPAYFVRDNGVGLRHALRRQAVRRLPAAAPRRRVRGHRHRPGHGPADRAPPRRPDLGRGRARQGRNVLLHAGREPWCRRSRSKS